MVSVLLDLGKNDYRGYEISKDIADMHKSVIVAADICKENVKKVNKALHPYAVEVSEGLEFNGEKDMKMIRAFFRRELEVLWREEKIKQSPRLRELSGDFDYLKRTIRSRGTRSLYNLFLLFDIIADIVL